MYKPGKIDMKKIERIKIMIKELGMNQTEFSDSIHMSPENLSRIVNGKHRFTDEAAEQIISNHKKYRLEWLLGYDDYKTEEEMIEATENFLRECVDMRNKTADAVWCLLEHNLRKCGEHLIFHHPSGRHFDSFERHTSGCYYTIEDSQGNVKKRLSAEEMDKLEQKIIRICEILVDDIMLDINIFS